MNLSKETLELIEKEARLFSDKPAEQYHFIQVIKYLKSNPAILASAGLTSVSPLSDAWVKVNRIEVIDKKGRSYVKYFDGKVEQSLQDEGRTLKIFITPQTK